MMLIVLVLLLSLGAWAQVWDLTAMDWSLDGVHMLLVSRGQLYVGLAPEGRALRPLYAGFWVEWARFAGTDQLVFSAPLPEGGWGLWRGTLAQDPPSLLYTSSVPLRWPTASWDGARVAFVEDWDRLMVLDLRTGSAELAVGGAWAKATPEFAPHGLGLLFAGLLLQEGEGSWELFHYDLRSRDLVQLTVDPYFDWCPRVSPDGLWVAFVSNRAGAPDIWVLPLAGGEPFPVTADPWEDAFPTWAPDGTVLAYASRRPQGWAFLTAGAY
ncbi:MAG: TolB family protein [Candidatus Bipolaricaulaceae bacterium]